MEQLLEKCHSILGKHRLHICINGVLRVTLTPQHGEPTNSQSFPSPSKLKDDLMIELACTKARLWDQNYSCFQQILVANFARHKLIGNLKILFNLRRIDHLIKHEYGVHNHSWRQFLIRRSKWHEKGIFATLTALKRITAFRWQMISSWKFSCCLWILVWEHLRESVWFEFQRGFS